MGWKNTRVTAEERATYEKVRTAYALDELREVLETDDRYQCLELSDEEAERIARAYAFVMAGNKRTNGRDTLRRLVDQRHPQRRYVVEVHYMAAMTVEASRYSEQDAHEFAKLEAEGACPNLVRVTSCNTVAINGNPTEPVSDEHTTFYK